MSITHAQQLTDQAITAGLKKRLALLLETQRRVQQHIEATLDQLHQATQRE